MRPRHSTILLLAASLPVFAHPAIAAETATDTAQPAPPSPTDNAAAFPLGQIVVTAQREGLKPATLTLTSR